MIKKIIILFSLILFLSYAISNVNSITLESSKDITQESGKIYSQQVDYTNAYKILNKPNFNIDSKYLLTEEIEKEIFQYSEEVKGEYSPVLNTESMFPSELVETLEVALYNSCDLSLGKLISMDNAYFNSIKNMCSDSYKPDLEEIYEIIPEVYNHKDEFANEYDAYKFISGSEYCIDMFQFNIKPNENNYVFVYDLGGSNGVVKIELTKLINNKFVTISEFKAQNNGFGQVIKYKESYYYIFLQYNYNLKNYDGIRLHRLGLNSDSENILIRYLLQDYIWKNIYINQDYSTRNITDYIDGIKEKITSNEYLENGSVSELYILNGEEEETDFILADENNRYYKIDFANLGVPVYINKSNHAPSNYNSTWYLKAKFYIYNHITDSVMELDNLELGKSNQIGKELVQMWFKKIDQKVFTFQVYHISDYNYVLNVILVEGDNVIHIRSDMFSPRRKFTVTEGVAFTDF